MIRVDVATCHRCGRPRRARELEGLCPWCLLRAGDTREYPILAIVGRGNGGTTYLAQHTPRGGVVVCKMLSDLAVEITASSLEEYRGRLAAFAHPNVAGVIDVGLSDSGCAFVVRPYVPGLSLLAYCTRWRPDWLSRRRLINSVEDAVRSAHAVGIAHGALSPSNVLVQTSGCGEHRVEVVDFAVGRADARQDQAALNALRSTVL